LIVLENFKDYRNTFAILVVIKLFSINVFFSKLIVHDVGTSKIIVLFIVHGYFVYSKFKWLGLENIKILGNYYCYCNSTNFFKNKYYIYIWQENERMAKVLQ
jgi:hypothetical protein